MSDSTLQWPASPVHAAAPRPSALVGLWASVTRWLADVGPADEVRNRQASSLREWASQLRSVDPHMAADLQAAADRHDGSGRC